MVSFHSKDDILVLLIYLGYLAYDIEHKIVYIPNEEIRREYINAIEETDWDYVIRAIADSDAWLRST